MNVRTASFALGLTVILAGSASAQMKLHPAQEQLWTMRPPTALRLTNLLNDCTSHGGSQAACGAALKIGQVAFIWSPGGGTVLVDGYRVYRTTAMATGPSQATFMRTLIAEQRGAQATFAIFQQSGTVLLGHCYEVTAYAGSQESAPSEALCVHSLPPIPAMGHSYPSPIPRMGHSYPAPTPVSNAVTIEITDDTYPSDTVVLEGGTITWINHDTDPHTVDAGPEGPPPELVLSRTLAQGERYTVVVPNIGRTYIFTYYCALHFPNMNGKVQVVHP